MVKAELVKGRSNVCVALTISFIYISKCLICKFKRYVKDGPCNLLILPPNGHKERFSQLVLAISCRSCNDGGATASIVTPECKNCSNKDKQAKKKLEWSIFYILSGGLVPCWPWHILCL